jgi:cytochrome P450
MSTPTLALAGLSQAERNLLFEQITALDPDAVAPLERARFGGAPGWLVSDVAIARTVLTKGIGVKSRPATSQFKLGGIGARQGGEVRSLKRELLLALGSLAEQENLVREHVAAALDARGGLLPTGLTEALTSATISLVAGVAPGSVDQAGLRNQVMQTWALIEDANATGSRHDAFYDYLRELLSASGSTFLSSLEARGWRRVEIAEELRAMVLAGWGSTAAAITSAISLGVAGDLRGAFVLDEVLRLYPPSFMIGRTVAESRRGLPFERGDILLISPWLIHRSSRGWRAPLDFDPERWKDQGPSTPRWFLPFGLGPRRCPAARFARTQAQVAGNLLCTMRRPDRTEVVLLENRSPTLVRAAR